MKRETARFDLGQSRLETILLSSSAPLTKVRAIMALGFGEEVAEDIVERHQLGQQTPVYYERLPLGYDEPGSTDY